MILNINEITKTFGKKVVLQDITLSIESPRLIALIAPNGSGKTTLLNIICNIEKSDFGNVTIFDLPNSNVDVFKKLTYMQDNSVLYNDLTGRDHIKLIQDIHHLPKEQVEMTLEKLKMTDYVDKKVKTYSLGMKQHLLFALAILPEPQILLMDEPLNGLDPASIVKVRNILKDLHSDGTTIIFSSHNLDQIDKLTDDIFFLKDQQLISLADISDENETIIFEIITPNAKLLVSLIKADFPEIDIISDHRCIIYCSTEEMEELSNNYQEEILEYQEQQNSLEKIYFSLYEDYKYDDTTI